MPDSRVRVGGGITKDRRWERTRAEVYSNAIGASVVVANSLVIAEILRSPAPVGTAIAVAPGHAAVGHSSEPDDVVVFALEGYGPAWRTSGSAHRANARNADHLDRVDVLLRHRPLGIPRPLGW